MKFISKYSRFIWFRIQILEDASQGMRQHPRMPNMPAEVQAEANIHCAHEEEARHRLDGGKVQQRQHLVQLVLPVSPPRLLDANEHFLDLRLEISQHNERQ
jgi:hypothetical protein